MALVAVFIDCIAVDIVLADVVALLAAAVILVAAEVTLVAADDTVRAALAGVGCAPFGERRAVIAVPWRADGRAATPRLVRAEVLAEVLAAVRFMPVPPTAFAVVRPAAFATVDPAALAAVPRAGRAAAGAVVMRAAGLTPAAEVTGLVLGRPAERVETLVLIDRVLLEFAGLRRALARAVVCTGTDFPPS